MRYLSVCSGIEAATCAWHPLGWDPVAFSEIEKFPAQVLAHHYPTVPNWGDMTKFEEWPDANVDLLVGGTPCQSFSVAGLRKGLADPRGSLMLTYGAIAAKYRPRWLVWENVPGVLSSNGGRDFGAFLGMLAELGYGFAYRVLDAQYFGVAQRRRRVFVVGYLGAWRRAAAVLFERASLSGHTAPRREAGESVANCLTDRADRGCTNSEGQRLIPLVSPALKARDYKGPSSDGDNDGAPLIPCVAHSLRAEGFDASEDDTGRGTPIVPVHAFDARQSDVIQYGDKTGPLDTDGHSVAVAFSCKDHGADAGEIAPTLRSMGHDGSHANGGGQVAVAFHENQRAEVTTSDTAGSLKVGGGKPGQGYPALMHAMRVRRLTPRECERLQGFPDDYTDIKPNGKPTPDGPRYKALGNSMAVPCMAWIGRRIAAVEEIPDESAEIMRMAR